ncbi:hypothetical protein GKZ90_0013975 [Flavobacterium sp. MC2016-06]|jgi:hypothetical protein|uniref:dual OB domain-containing protein n=1 Tax=Flavobacterium sp. MC2016-06 TaxID=2676308 RepID=UPI0012BA6AEC|nr:hypothetical protein [Flavobacterium sp. MC2016-06]MBU3861724.1 hypothetical protein [Flavobacterium sp. MC2016-06]
MDVLIVAKTNWGAYFCIGGIEIQTNKYIRLMDLNGGYQPSNTPFKVGQIWDVTYISTPGVPPHVEDVRITKSKYIDTVTPKKYIVDNCNIWQGDLNNIYDSKLVWDNGKGFLNNPQNVPINSVGFWQNDRDLILNHSFNKFNYSYSYNNIFKRDKKMPYKGEIPPVKTIPAGTLIRVSLAKWWNPVDKPEIEKRCYLQLSGWYN